MCNPMFLAAASTAIGVVRAGAEYVGGRKLASAQELAVNQTAAEQSNVLARRDVQIGAQASEDRVNAIINAVAAQGRISASASSMGSDAATVAQMSNAEAFKAGRGASIQDLNTQNALAENQQARRNNELERVSKINTIQKPTPLSLVLGIAQAGLQGANTYYATGG